jgi:hypothetical protein
MATDSTLNETDGAPEESREDSVSSGTPSPPRPPRPGKRSKGSGRIPMPLPQTRAELGSGEVDADAAGDLTDGAPPVDIDADRAEPAIPLQVKRAKPASLPEESFADIDADLADHSPNAPFDPWRGLPSLQAEPVDITPPRGTPINAINFGRDDQPGSDPEPTVVGKVPDNLMELSAAGGDENTRAFTAPRELIELAKRKREERDVVNSNAPVAPAPRAVAACASTTRI